MEKTSAWADVGAGDQQVRYAGDGLRNAAVALELAWRDHVERARDRCGVHAFLCMAAPRYLSMIPHLRREAERILGEAVRVRCAVERRRESATWLCSTTWLSAELTDVAQQMLQYDKLETELLRDALESE